MNAADRILEALRCTGPDAYRADPDRLGQWWAYCPSCNSRAAGERRLRIIECSSTRVVLLCSIGCSYEAIMAALKRAEDRYPADWSDSPEHPCPAYDAIGAEVALEQDRRRRRQQDAERRIEGVA
jgi:hypothetical protein